MRLLTEARDRGRAWAARYELRGAASGAPRDGFYWTDGESVRAEADGGSLWLEGPKGILVVDAGQEHWHPRGVSTMVLRPFPEVDALRSSAAAAAWVDTHLVAPAAHTVLLGRRALLHLRDDLKIVEDEETGLVLSIEMQGQKGALSLKMTSWLWETAGAALFARGDRGVA